MVLFSISPLLCPAAQSPVPVPVARPLASDAAALTAEDRDEQDFHVEISAAFSIDHLCATSSHVSVPVEYPCEKFPCNGQRVLEGNFPPPPPPPLSLQSQWKQYQRLRLIIIPLLHSLNFWRSQVRRHEVSWHRPLGGLMCVAIAFTHRDQFTVTGHFR